MIFIHKVTNQIMRIPLFIITQVKGLSSSTSYIYWTFDDVGWLINQRYHNIWPKVCLKKIINNCSQSKMLKVLIFTHNWCHYITLWELIKQIRLLDSLPLSFSPSLSLLSLPLFFSNSGFLYISHLLSFSLSWSHDYALSFYLTLTLFLSQTCSLSQACSLSLSLLDLLSISDLLSFSISDSLSFSLSQVYSLSTPSVHKWHRFWQIQSPNYIESLVIFL